MKWLVKQNNQLVYVDAEPDEFECEITDEMLEHGHRIYYDFNEKKLKAESLAQKGKNGRKSNRNRK